MSIEEDPVHTLGLTQQQQSVILEAIHQYQALGVYVNPWALMDMAIGKAEADALIHILARRYPLRYRRYWLRWAWERITGGD